MLGNRGNPTVLFGKGARDQCSAGSRGRGGEGRHRRPISPPRGSTQSSRANGRGSHLGGRVSVQRARIDSNLAMARWALFKLGEWSSFHSNHHFSSHGPDRVDLRELKGV